MSGIREIFDGVNVAGYLRTESGVGAAARGYVRALRALDLPVALHDLSPLTGNRSEDDSLDGFAHAHPYDLSLVCADVEPHFAIISQLGCDFFQAHHSIGVWAWELLRFPEKWLDRFAYYDEIWVGSSFIANTLAPVSPVPVVRIPPVLTPPKQASRERGRQRLGVAPDEFVFLFVFDFHSHLERKNPMAVIDAFKAAFAPSDPARLVLKCVNTKSNPAGFAALSTDVQEHSIALYDGYWPSSDIRDLMAACDAYVSLHRSEGTGLTITDAMALAKPVIATGWSGNMDFMSIANSFPVAYELTEIKTTVGPYSAGEVWANPSVDHAASLMRYVYEHPAEALRRGAVAQRDLEADYSDAGVARLIAQRLGGIQQHRHLPQLRRRTWESYRQYEELGAQIRDIVRDTVSRDSTVSVVSKGDEALLPHDVCRAWHFPRTADGVYAGSYPADSAEAISHLETLRAEGAGFLVFPRTSLWWLDHYRGFREHLDAHYRPVVTDLPTCLIYDLRGSCHEPNGR
jgi:glycosyltransferase involved in cell wall biosynthesis